MRKVIKAYEVVYPNAIRVLKGAAISILREETNPEWAGWLWCRSADGQEGWISKDFLEIQGSNATMTKDYDAREVAAQPEELVQVLKEEHGWAWVKKSDSSEGWIPLANLGEYIPQIKLKMSTSRDDIEEAMRIVATFGASIENLIKIKEYISKELLELGDNRNLYFLECDSETVGMVQIIFKKADGDPELANGKDVAHVHALQVAKNHHRKGYAENLMRLVEKQLKDSGIKKLTLGVDADNDKALGLYKKLNYSLLKTVDGRSPEVELHYLQKSLT